MKIQMFFACALVVNVNGFAHAQSSQSCDVQVIFDCELNVRACLDPPSSHWVLIRKSPRSAEESNVTMAALAFSMKKVS